MSENDAPPDTETETPIRKRRTRAQIEADREALQALHDSDTIPTDAFIKVLQEWQKRYTACEDAERNLQRCGIKFTRIFDYERRAFTNNNDRFTNVSPDTPETLTKLKIRRTINALKRSYGASGYGLNWLENQLEKQFGLTVKTYNDEYTLVWTKKITAAELTTHDWDGTETAASIGDMVRNYVGIDWRSATLTITPDPERAADAVARAAAKTAAEAKDTTAEADELSNTQQELNATTEADIAEGFRRAAASINEALLASRAQSAHLQEAETSF